MLTIKDVAARLKVTVRTVKNWKKDGKIAFITLPGGDVRIDEEHFEQWVRYRTTTIKS